MQSFVNLKPSPNGETTLSFTDVGKSCHCPEFFSVANMSFNAIRKNKNHENLRFSGLSMQIVKPHQKPCSVLVMIAS